MKRNNHRQRYDIDKEPTFIQKALFYFLVAVLAISIVVGTLEKMYRFFVG